MAGNEQAAIVASVPPISAENAISYAVDLIDDHYDRLEFLVCWRDGNWQALREEWPEAFKHKRPR
ncbi:hypothetical protein IP86_03080 [Rhodopseudomonas sp. AAP120]|uniref:hypothetical protein n=1 Tax=Rhodopseudomonas sp. AAP120 TaxID=1523430 RepID=UPI0006B966AC|nr:hypothetical protein [Rhodopseudomonas sp. AAP120]KPG01806.1 hypothetical protein IP86_03080 [Rhodopseudomonas sp. AAP120]